MLAEPKGKRGRADAAWPDPASPALLVRARACAAAGGGLDPPHAAGRCHFDEPVAHVACRPWRSGARGAAIVSCTRRAACGRACEIAGARRARPTSAAPGAAPHCCPRLPAMVRPPCCLASRRPSLPARRTDALAGDQTARFEQGQARTGPGWPGSTGDAGAAAAAERESARAGAALRLSPSPSHSGISLPSLSDSRTASGGLASSLSSGLPPQVPTRAPPCQQAANAGLGDAVLGSITLCQCVGRR